jgi:hypothetical protein
MTNGEYQQLIDFLGRRFEEINGRFEAIDRRFDAVETKLAEHDVRFREIFDRFDDRCRRLVRLEQRCQANV